MTWLGWIIIFILFVALMSEIKKITCATQKSARHLRFITQQIKLDRKIMMSEEDLIDGN